MKETGFKYSNGMNILLRYITSSVNDPENIKALKWMLDNGYSMNDESLFIVYSKSNLSRFSPYVELLLSYGCPIDMTLINSVTVNIIPEIKQMVLDEISRR